MIPTPNVFQLPDFFTPVPLTPNRRRMRCLRRLDSSQSSTWRSTGGRAKRAVSWRGKTRTSLMICALALRVLTDSLKQRVAKKRMRIEKETGTERVLRRRAPALFLSLFPFSFFSFSFCACLIYSKCLSHLRFQLGEERRCD